MGDIFLQSLQWKKFQEFIGRKVFRIEGVGQFIKMNLPFRKSYLYCPGKQIKKIPEDLKKIAKKENAIFIRSGSFPRTTIILDLKKSEEELLKEMKEKTRYNIRLSLKKNLKIEIGSNELFSDFWKLMEETALRQKIKNFPKNYYEKLLKIKNFSYLATVYFKDNALASGLFIDFDETTTYLFGASSNEQKKLMAPYFLHWTMIKNAKKNDQKYYDFWGINPENPKDLDYLEKWEGIAKFKKGFGGKIFSYPGTFELPIQKIWYRLYRLIKISRN